MAADSSSVRSRQTELTRRAVLDAARRLFEIKGYPSTTIRELAREAGVAVRTVYLAFGSKQGVILALIDAMSRAAGEEEARAEAAEARNGATIVRIVARIYRRFYERDYDIIKALREGAGAHPDLAAAFERGRMQSRTNMSLVCARIEQLGDLRPDIDVDQASGHAQALVSPDTYLELVRTRGWSQDRYEEWLSWALSEAVLKTKSRRSKGR